MPLLFFSGGTALKETARLLAGNAVRSVHVITPFDSGGSSAALRRAFAMPAVGDLRARILALADAQSPGIGEVRDLFGYRLPACDGQEWDMLREGTHPLLRSLTDARREQAHEALAWVAARLPADFPLAGASVGNLFLAAAYLRAGRRLGPAVTLLSRMVRARGLVLPVAETPAHLVVRLESGELRLGQHTFTGKTGPGPSSPIARIWLARTDENPEPAHLAVSLALATRIRRAGSICYPVGSFYSSLLANLLPSGVGRAVAANPGPKIFVPNMGTDPELLGHTLRMQVERLLETLRADAPDAPSARLVSHVLVDGRHGDYPGGIPKAWLAAEGITVRSRPLVSPRSAPLAEADRLTRALLRLAGAG